MFQRSLVLLVAAAIGLALAGVANAQPGLSTGPDYDLIDKADRIDERANAESRLQRQAGIEALQARNYPVAEKTFNDLLLRNPDVADANFLMGLAKLGLEKWTEAKGFLEIAVRQDPKRPEAKTRLALTYARLGDIDSAMKQRAELASLNKACKAACDDAAWIVDGLALLDQALLPNRSAADVNPLASAVVAPGGVLPAISAPVVAGIAASAVTPKDFDPARYSLVTFNDARDLYELLTQEGRCPPNKLAEPRQPCALILYTPMNDTDETLAANFKPVFRVVSKASVWAIHNKKLQKVRIEDLYFDQEQIIGKKTSTYRSAALVGNLENTTNCEQARPCLSSLVTQDMFRMYSNMPDSVVEIIWGGGMKDPGTVRVR